MRNIRAREYDEEMKYFVGVVVVAAIAAGVWVLADRPAWYPVAPQSPAAGDAASTTPAPAAGSSTPSSTAYTTGVSGKVLAGPTCPVERIPPDPACAPRPLAATVSAYRAGSARPLAAARSGEDGSFSLALPPGAYTLKADTGAMLPRCVDDEISVPTTGYAHTTISCDTGIR